MNIEHRQPKPSYPRESVPTFAPARCPQDCLRTIGPNSHYYIEVLNLAIDLSRFHDCHALVEFERKTLTCEINIYADTALLAGWDLSAGRATYFILPAVWRQPQIPDPNPKDILILQVPENFTDWQVHADTAVYCRADYTPTPEELEQHAKAQPRSCRMIVEGVYENGRIQMRWNLPPDADLDIGDIFVPVKVERGIGILMTLPADFFKRNRKAASA